MAYIQPSTTIYLFKDIPFDSDYTNTGYFNSKADQETYFFTTHGVYQTLGNYYYQREQVNVIKVKLPFEDCYQVNYLAFKNTNSHYEQKWFYAFVTNVEYISDSVTALHYEIDVMQTWTSDYLLEQCFIERQHSTTDGIGDNLAPETLDIGEPVFNNYQELEFPLGYDPKRMYALVCICDVNIGSVQGRNFQGIYSGAEVYGFDPTILSELNALNQFLAQYIQRPDVVVGMYMCPRVLCPTRGGGSGDFGAYYISGNDTPPRFDITLPKLVSTGNTLDGYAPRNMKLYTYPYNYLYIDNALGEALSLRYEYFGRGLSTYLQPHLAVDGTQMQPVTMRLRPSNYKGSGFETVGGVSRPRAINTELLSIKNYPMCSWNFDSYEAWTAQSSVPEAIGLGTSLLSLGMSTSDSNGGGSIGLPVGGIIHQVGGYLQRSYRASIAADMLKGSLMSSNVNIANNNNAFYYGRVSINSETAKRIDDYFTMFGYSQGVVATPNRHARSRFTYVKTLGCEISGNIPNDDQVKIKGIFDKGIRFWVDPSDIGNYQRANNVLS